MPTQASSIVAYENVSTSVAPLVTVIIPVYNQGQYIEETLDSVLQTKYPNLELLIIDDASPDAADDRIRSWLAAHPDIAVNYTRNAQNLGLTRTLNEAISHAKGDFICLLAGDDLLLPTGISARLEYLLQHPDKLAVFADSHVIDAASNQTHMSGIEDLKAIIGMRKAWLEVEELVLYSVLFLWAVPGPVFMCRKEAYSLVGPYDEDLLVEDWDMYLRLAAIGKLGFLNAYVSRYRVHQTNMSTTRRRSLGPSIIKTLDKHRNCYRGTNRLRLLAVYARWRFDESSSVFFRALLVIPGNTLPLISNVFYRLLGAGLFRWYSYRRVRASTRGSVLAR